ncbi:MAG: LuxR C-terminal-related transcriptional regulator [Crocinitomicaceae bacterium]
MSILILSTKLHIPQLRPDTILRLRLFEMLNKGLQGKLTLISAPAGFGKTTIATSWLEKQKEAIAWLSLDASDSDLPRFLSYVVASLQTIDVQIGKGLLSMLQAAQLQSTEMLLTSLINDLEQIATEFIFVLDDYHALESPQIDELIGSLLNYMPPQMHLVIITREDPNLSFAALRVRGQLTELRVSDLRFTTEESRHFLNETMGLSLSQDKVTKLEQRTEGWVAGLQLAALSMQGQSDIVDFIRDFTGSHRFVLDYLVEEVLQRQPEHLSSFLLQTSILDKMSGSLCDSITERKDSTTMLDVLDRGNLFVIPLDKNRQWYRYHHLFAEVLYLLLVEEQPDHVVALHHRASIWYEKNNMMPDAIRHALSAKNFDRAANLIEQVWSVMDINMESTTWVSWVKKLPDKLLRTRPVLSVGYAWALLENGEVDACETRLQDAERWLAPSGDVKSKLYSSGNEMIVVDEEQFQSLPATIAIARAYRALTLGDIASTVTYAQRAFKLTHKDNYIGRIQSTTLLGLALYKSGDLEAAIHVLSNFQKNIRRSNDILTAIGITFILTEIKEVQGRLHEAFYTYQQALQLIASHDTPIPAGMVDLYRGISELYCEQGDLKVATQHLQTSKKLSQQAQITGEQHRLCIAEARIAEAQGDLDRALDLLDDAERLYVRSAFPAIRPISALRTQIWISQGRLTEALMWAHDQGLSSEDKLSFLQEFEHITLVRVLIAQYRNDKTDTSIREAIGLLERLLPEAEEGGRVGRVIEILVLQSIAHEACDNMSLALISLKRALILAEPEGYSRIFINEGTPIVRLLQEAEKHNISPNYVKQLQLACGQVDQSLLDPLSDRELDVLALLKTDLTGPKISQKLMIGLSTMRTHTQNIYTKLGVNNRREAVRRAKKLGL